jgi:hypothetical protein
MAITVFRGPKQVVYLLQCSLGRGRLAHGYLFNNRVSGE